ncbi:Holliday junction resolvase RecU [Exiguobacterium aestuarii]|uniref:Holliday junction resolvase RecU n=1 Tax=Exiguobacterium aestuarii TaxID=273527 RepID=A0ABW2PJF2_9BACL|nr:MULTISPECIES: Holliday junction resolvase RecU [Exiguobacterium]MCT4786599.1 Holliday junction resolvase RecU [Exiguobacterium aestuarii]
MAARKANLGKYLERLVIQSNRVYLLRQEAVIHQAHPEVKTIKGLKPFYNSKAGLDFYGVYDGKYITFDTKETGSKTSFPLENIKDHQYGTLINTEKQNGIAFFLVRFNYFGETYFLNAEQARRWWEQQNEKNGRKSIPYKWFLENCKVVKRQSAVALDWLSIVREELGKRD